MWCSTMQCIALKSKSEHFLPQNCHDLIFSTFPFFFSTQTQLVQLATVEALMAVKLAD